MAVFTFNIAGKIFTITGTPADVPPPEASDNGGPIYLNPGTLYSIVEFDPQTNSTTTLAAQAVDICFVNGHLIYQTYPAGLVYGYITRHDPNTFTRTVISPTVQIHNVDIATGQHSVVQGTFDYAFRLFSGNSFVYADHSKVPAVYSGVDTIKYSELTIPGYSETINLGIGILDTTYPAFVAGIKDVSLNLTPVASLFTTEADTVNFDNLTADQLAAIAADADLYNGLGGNDVVTLPDIVNANQLVAAGKTLGWQFAQTFNGGAGSDTINGGSGNDIIDGGADSDVLTGGKGNDELFGGAGNLDILDGGEGVDKFHGGDGLDIVTYGFGAAGIGLKMGLNGAAFGDAAGDELLDGIEIVLGSDFADKISLGPAALAVYGSGGDDEIWGTAQNDSLFGDLSDSFVTNALLAGAGAGGQDGADKLFGGEGDDKLRGGAGNDTLDGGAGHNTASFSGKGSSYTIYFQTPLNWNVVGPDGTDNAVLIQDFKFDNATVTNDQLFQQLVSTEEIDEITAQIDLLNHKATNIDELILLCQQSIDAAEQGMSASEFAANILSLKRVIEAAMEWVQKEPIVGKELALLYGATKIVGNTGIQLVEAGSRLSSYPKIFLDAGKETIELVLKTFNDAASLYLEVRDLKDVGDVVEFTDDYFRLIDQISTSKANLELYLTKSQNIANQIKALETELRDKFAIADDLPKVRYAGDSDATPSVISTLPALPVSGKAADGYIGFATIFADANLDGLKGDEETVSFTNSSGFFSLPGGDGPLVLFGGTDTSTGLAFNGYLSAPSGSSVVTPLTTLMALLSSDALAEQKVLSSFGLSSNIDLNTFDPIAAAQAGSADGAATTAAIAKVYDTVSIIASTLVAAGGDFSSGVKEAFAAIAAAIGGSGINLTNQANVSALIAVAAQSDGLVLGQGVADSVASIIVASNALLDQKAQSGATGDELLNAIAAIERVVQGTASNAIQQAGNDPDQLQALVAAFSGDNLDDAVSTALEHLGISDTTAPTVTPVADQTNEATSAAGATGFFTAIANDNVDGTVPIVFKEGNSVVHSGDVFSLGTHTITAIAVDAAGNQTSQNFKFNVVDTTAPTLTPVANQTREATSAAGAAAFFTATATDLVDGAPPVVFKEGNMLVQSGDIFGISNHTITASTTDAAGNLSLETFTISVTDTTAPTLTPIADQTLQAATTAGAAAFFATTATDLVDGTNLVVFKEGDTIVHSGDIFGVGVHTITATAVDASGNTATDIFEIDVLSATSDNHDPIARSDSNGVAKGKTVSVSANKGVLANDSDSDHDYLSVGSVNGSAANVGHSIKGDYGTLMLNADGSYSYTATAKALPSKIFAQDTFTYTNVDGHGGSDTATLTFSVYDPSFNYQAGSNTILWGDGGKNVLDGSAGHDILYGGYGADVLIGGKGDIMAGGKGADQFVFRPDFGANTILDFDVKNDHLQFDDSIFNSVKSIFDHTTNTPWGALISDGHGDSVLLVGVNKAQLLAHSSDLLIS